MSVVVASCTLEELFAGNEIKASDNTAIVGQLHLPEYQRPYRWGQEQVGRLLNDLRNHFQPEPGIKSPEHLFYLGSIILHQQEHGSLLNIIDGQQRITTLGLLALLQQAGTEPNLHYDSPVSQRQIIENIEWLRNQTIFALSNLDLSRINITLVVTRSEDDAYRFFETQNTGGVRLSGPDIIKAHHLRVIQGQQQNDYARLWEAMGDLAPLVDAVMKARYWQALDFRELPSHREPQPVRREIVSELAEATLNRSADVAYPRLKVERLANGSIAQTLVDDGYAMRQPLNAGINSIHYLQYFHRLRQQLFDVEKPQGDLQDFHWFYKALILQVDGCAYIKRLYDACLLLYVSHHGRANLFEAALWLFRVVYSPRVSNEKTVRENSVSAFARNNPVFDWILMSYNPQQCMARLKQYDVVVDPANLEPGNNGVKKRFVESVARVLNLDLCADTIAADYDEELVAAIERAANVQYQDMELANV